MPHWLIKSALQRVISWLPGSAWCNELFQRYVTKSIDLPETAFQGRLEEAARFLDRFRSHQPLAPDPFTVLEVGTGWYPTLPLAFYLCGASEIHTFDIANHLERDRLTLVLDYFCAEADTGVLQRHLPCARMERVERLRQLRSAAKCESPGQVLERLNIHARVRDACETGLPSASIDFIFTCGVLEYVPRPALPKLLSEFRRVASPRSAMVHWLNLVDQYHWFDPSVGRLDFLQYSESQWRWRDSPLTSNNRRRIADYRELLAHSGFVIKAEENQAGSDDDLKGLRLAPEFQRYSKQDLLVLYSLVTAVPEAGASS
jgi:Methyltransferase domain